MRLVDEESDLGVRRLFCLALPVFDTFFRLLGQKDFARRALMQGCKLTWKNAFQYLVTAGRSSAENARMSFDNLCLSYILVDWGTYLSAFPALLAGGCLAPSRPNPSFHSGQWGISGRPEPRPG